MPYDIHKFEDGSVVFKIKKYEDNRGSFSELYKQSQSTSLGISESFTQLNMSTSKAGVIRGLHYQLGESAQGKLLYVIQGEIQDIIVPLNTIAYRVVYLKECEAIYVPPSFMHGFNAIKDSMILYYCTKEYNPSYERGVRYDDSTLSLPWANPLIISEKDLKLPYLTK